MFAQMFMSCEDEKLINFLLHAPVISVVIFSLQAPVCQHKQRRGEHQQQGKVDIAGTYTLYSVDTSQYSQYLLAMEIPQQAVDIISQE